MVHQTKKAKTGAERGVRLFTQKTAASPLTQIVFVQVAIPWMKVVTDTLEHPKNKDFLDAKNIVLATVDKDGQPYARYHVHRGFVQDQDGNDTPHLLTTTDMLMPKGEIAFCTLPIVSPLITHHTRGHRQVRSHSVRHKLFSSLIIPYTVGQIESSRADKNSGAKGEYVFWTSPTGDQIRVQGLVHLYRPDSPAKSQSVSTLEPSLDWEHLRQEQWKKMSGHLRASFLHKAPGSPVDEDFEETTPERIDADAKEAEEGLKRFCLVVFEARKVDWSQQNVRRHARFSTGERPC